MGTGHLSRHPRPCSIGYHLGTFLVTATCCRHHPKMSSRRFPYLRSPPFSSLLPTRSSAPSCARNGQTLHYCSAPYYLHTKHRPFPPTGPARSAYPLPGFAGHISCRCKQSLSCIVKHLLICFGRLSKGCSLSTSPFQTILPPSSRYFRLTLFALLMPEPIPIEISHIFILVLASKIYHL